MGLAGLGLINALYLTSVKLSGKYALCGPIGDCKSVNSSVYSEVFGVPIALLGAIAYLLIIALLLLEGRGKVFREFSPLIVFGISLAGVIYSAYLTYIEIAVLNAICPYCVLSALILVVLFVLSTLRIIRGEVQPHEQYQI